MALADVRLSLLAFPQAWARGALTARVLLLPVGDPETALDAGLPVFAGTSWPLRVTILPSPDGLLGVAPAMSPGAFSFTFTAEPPAGAADLYAALRIQLAPVPPKPIAQRVAAVATAEIRKQLPGSYTSAFSFERPEPGTTLTDEFGCALRDTVPALETDGRPPATVTWGAILSFALRQPELARALGLIYDIPVPDNIPDALPDGGWLYVDLDPLGAVQPLPPTAVRSYAALLPPLSSIVERPLFAAVLFPVGTTDGTYDEPLAEAARNADGFAKIVHSSQALTADAASGGHNQLKPATDAGIDLGWDDEQVTAWLNRQLRAMHARLGGPAAKFEAPLGVAGYRIDVSTHEDPDPPTWQSLCRAISIGPDGESAPLQFPPAPAQAAFTVNFDGELTVEPTPARSVHATTGTAWLPQHFTRWQGGSLVANDPTLFRLTGISPRAADGTLLSVPPPTFAGAAPLLPLRYGTLYHFRCRFADLTGGGPTVDDKDVGAAFHPVATTRFTRHVQPKTVQLATNIAPPAPGTETEAGGAVETINVWRPLISYPELVFAGVTDQAVIDALVADADAAREEQRGIGVNDPDVTHVRVSVRVRAAAHDTDAALQNDGFRELYSIRIPFPPFDADRVLEPGTALALNLRYDDVADVATMDLPDDGDTELPIPRARDIRLELTSSCDDKPNYFGAPWVREGLTAHVSTRAPSGDESPLLLDGDDNDLRGIFLRPGADLLQRLADELDVAASGLTLSARPGERVVFAASGALRHTLAGDHSAVTFASENELVGRWLNVVHARLGRDWTWDGLEDRGFEVTRRDDVASPGDPVVIGQLQVPLAVSPVAVAGPGIPGVDRRSSTRLIFLDAVDSNPPAGAFPKILHPQYTMEPRIREFTDAQNAALRRTEDVRLPIAVRPRQTPKIVSAGIAFSPYDPAADYSSTNLRRRSLWIELEEPVENDADALFARVVAYGPDPLLSGAITHQLRPVPPMPVGATNLFEIVEKTLPHPPGPPPLAVNPEPIRVIRPRQPEDGSGRDAMDLLIAGGPPAGETKPRHYLIPAPPGIDREAPEMFGFWSYELRIGHTEWSNEQECFGRPLVVKGMQHPAPALMCNAFRVNTPKPTASRIVVTAPFATPVFADQKLTRFDQGDPRTRLWVLLYAQVAQADGRSHRNVLFARAPATPRLEMTALGSIRPVTTRDLFGVAEFNPAQVQRALAVLALPADTPLSALVVELLPGDHLLQTEETVGTTDLLFATIEWKGYFLSDIPDRAADPSVDARARLSNSDPLGRELGTMTSRRILRCSPLTPIAPAC
jgi:hypothetical protein